MPSREFKAVIFDLDETLIDSQKGFPKADAKVAQMIKEHLKRKKLNLKRPQILEETRVFDDKMNLEFKYDRDEWWQPLLRNLGFNLALPRTFVRKLTISYWHTYARSTKPYRDTLSTLRYLKKRGYLLGLLSDTDGSRGMKDWRISKLPFTHFFDAIVVAGEDTVKTKPSPEPYELIARKLGVIPSECIFIGDKPFTDIKGAKTSGMKAVHICRRDWGVNAKADWTVKSLSKLRRIL